MLSNIKAIQKTSLIDYPNKISCVIFLSGCNFRCGYCHNPDLILKDLKNVDEETIFNFLEKRKDWLDGVVISGGEPLLNNEILEFIKKIKEMGYLVKIDTNGSNPELLKRLIKENSADYIAMDIKNTINKYKDTVNADIDIKKILESIDLIKNSYIDHEFRCTVLPNLHNKEGILEICNLIKGNKFVLQQFNNATELLDSKFKNYKQFSKEELEDIKKVCSSIVECELRI